MAEASILLHDICAYHPFSHAAEWIRFALYGQANLTAAVWIKTGFISFFLASLWVYSPDRAIIRKD